MSATRNAAAGLKLRARLLSHPASLRVCGRWARVRDCRTRADCVNRWGVLCRRGDGGASSRRRPQGWLQGYNNSRPVSPQDYNLFDRRSPRGIRCPTHKGPCRGDYSGQTQRRSSRKGKCRGRSPGSNNSHFRPYYRRPTRAPSGNLARWYIRPQQMRCSRSRG